MRKCRGIKTCETLTETFTQPNRKGINLVRSFNFKTGRIRFIGVAFKKTERDKGMFMNFCPFCGGKIAPKL
jgi:hypothetical protein